MSMLVVVWESMYAAISRLQAEEQLQGFAVAVTASPAYDRAGVAQRESVLEGWRKQMQGAFDKAVETARRVSPRELQRIMRGAFEEAVRE